VEWRERWGQLGRNDKMTWLRLFFCFSPLDVKQKGMELLGGYCMMKNEGLDLARTGECELIPEFLYLINVRGISPFANNSHFVCLFVWGNDLVTMLFSG